MANEVIKSQKSMLRGPYANNGFKIFISEYAKRHGSDCETMVKCGKEWNRLTAAQKDKYRKIKPANLDNDQIPQDGGCCRRKRKPSCPKPRCKPKKKPCAAKRKCPPKRCARKPRCPKKRKTCPKPRCRPKRRVKCQKPGPITNNGYLNFLRVYRRKHCGLKPNELLIKAARAWCRLPECKKDRYRRQACKVTKSCRHKKRRVCQQIVNGIPLATGPSVCIVS